MRKNFLILMLMALLPLAGWANKTVIVEGNAVELSSDYVVYQSGANQTTPVPTIIGGDWITEDGIFKFNDTTKEFETATINGSGNYFLKATKDSKTYYIPFQVGVKALGRDATKVAGVVPETPWTASFADFDYVHNQASWNASYTDEYGGLKAYYTTYSDEDNYVFADETAFNQDIAAGGHAAGDADRVDPTDHTSAWKYPTLTKQSWWGAINAPGANYPWIEMNNRVAAGKEAVCPVFEYYNSAAVGDTLVVKPWGLKAIGKFGCASLPAEFEKGSWKMTGAGAEWQEGDFDITKFGVVLLPEVFAFVSTPSVEFNGVQTQGPAYSIVGSNGLVPTSFKYVNASTNAKTDGITGVGTYYYEFTFTNTNNDVIGTVNSNTFKVTGKKMIINPAYTYKKYGDDDPIYPSFEIDAATKLIEGDTPEEAIRPFLRLRRVEGNDGEAVGAYLYYIEFDDSYYTSCQYDISILQNNSNLVITKAPLTIEVTNNWKKYNAQDEKPYTWKVASGSSLKNDDTVEGVEIEITREAGEAVNATLNGNVASPLEPGDGYAFTGESTNYFISFANKYLIVPTDNYDGIKVLVSNPALQNKAEYTYTGKAIEPGKAETDYVNHLIVKDGDNVLTSADYVVKSYTSNVHAGTATVTVTMQGSYTSKDINGYFTIKKAPLYVYPADKTLQPGQGLPELTLMYGKTGDTGLTEFWVNNEGTVDGPAAENGPKDYVAPTIKKTPLDGMEGYKLTLEGGSAADYELDRGEGLITYGKSIVRIYAGNKEKVFGQGNPELTWTIYKVVDNVETQVTEGPLYEALGGDQPYFTIAREPGENVGTYDITFDGPTVYPQGVAATYVKGTFTITPKDVYLKGDDCSKVYGDNNPTFEASVYEAYDEEKNEYTGKWTNEKKTEAGITNQSFYHVGVQGATWSFQQQRWILASEDVNEEGYAVQPYYHTTSETIGNYHVVLATGKFTITPAPLTITADNKTKVFGAADPELTVTATGLKFQDVITKGENGDIVITREAGENAKTYPITITLNKVDGKNKLPNYTVTLVPGTFTITAQGLYVVANDQAISYGQAINPYDVKIYTDEAKETKLNWNEDKIAEVLKLTTTVTKVGATKNAFTLVPADNANYAISEFTNGWLTIAALKEIPLDKDSLATITSIELKQVLKDHQGRTVNVYLPGRNMAANDWYAWVLPFEVKQRDIFKDNIWGYGVIEKLDETKTTAKTVSFGVTVQPIDANTPFIVKVDKPITAAEMKRMKITNVTIGELNYTNVNPSVGGENTVQFIGFYQENENDLDNTVRVLRREAAGKPMAWWPGSGIKEGQFVRTNALLQFPTEKDAQDARIFVEDPNGGTTDITGVVTVNNAGVQGWYNMNGVKMQNAPVEKGVYIKDGKKVVIK